MRVHGNPCVCRRWRLTWVCVCVAVVVGGCGRTAPSPVELAGLDREYVSVASGEICIVLLLRSDGGFLVSERRAGDPERHGSREMPMRPEPAPVAAGEWTVSDGLLDLAGDGWMASYEADSTRVEIPDRVDTLSSLRWVTSTEGSPFSACDLVSRAEFDEFLHPTEGRGRSGL
ncbi:hypothetical protein KAW64_10905 [bacterium]|nr:hypothetical protein [bacterium]